MKSPLSDFLDDLRADDLAVALGLREALLHAGPDGRVDRVVWEEASATAYVAGAQQLQPHQGTTHESALSDGEHPVGDLFTERVPGRLAKAGLVVVERADPERPDGLRLTGAADPRSPTTDGRALDLVAATVARLERARADRYAVPPESTAVHLDDPSRVYAVGLTKIYKRRRVVSEVDISVEQGEIVGLLGPNGAGKTTTFYMMVGLIPPDAGSVHLDDEVITDTPMYKRARKGIGYLAQEPSIFRKLSVEDNIRAILETLKLPRAEEKQRLEQLLQELGLEGLRRSKAYSLSGGERRRLEITRALVQRPKFLLLDEPFAGIDPIAVNDIQQIVRGLKSRGIGVIISDHNVEQTLEIVDRAYIMYEGSIRVSGTVSELVWNDEVAEIYLGPTLTARMRGRYTRPVMV